MRTLLILVTILLVGCASTPLNTLDPIGPSNPLDSLRTFTKADLAQASAIASAGGDQIAAACYDAISKHLDTIQGVPSIKGAFSVFEYTRLGLAKVRSGIPQEIHVSCAPVVLDVQHTLIKLGLIGAGVPIL